MFDTAVLATRLCASKSGPQEFAVVQGEDDYRLIKLSLCPFDDGPDKVVDTQETLVVHGFDGVPLVVGERRAVRDVFDQSVGHIQRGGVVLSDALEGYPDDISLYHCVSSDRRPVLFNSDNHHFQKEKLPISGLNARDDSLEVLPNAPVELGFEEQDEDRVDNDAQDDEDWEFNDGTHIE